MKRILFVVLMLQSILALCSAQTNALPKEVKYTGKVKYTQSFSDALCAHLLVCTATKFRKEPTAKEAEDLDFGDGYALIFVYDYLKTKTSTSYVLNWKLQDGIQACNWDFESFFINKPTITDLDNNGIKEVTMAYAQTCTSDVSPYELKVIMRENKNKYGLRGRTFDPYEKSKQKPPCCVENEKEYDEKDNGKYLNENDFKGSPKEFLAYAKKLWVASRVRPQPQF